MKRFALIAGTALLALAACNNDQKTAAPGAVSGNKSACCATANVATECPMAAGVAATPAPGAVGAAKTGCCKDKAAAPAPGAVSDVKSGCDSSAKSGCSKSGNSSCPMSGKTNG